MWTYVLPYNCKVRLQCTISRHFRVARVHTDEKSHHFDLPLTRESTRWIVTCTRSVTRGSYNCTAKRGLQALLQRNKFCTTNSLRVKSEEWEKMKHDDCSNRTFQRRRPLIVSMSVRANRKIKFLPSLSQPYELRSDCLKLWYTVCHSWAVCGTSKSYCYM